MAEQPLRYRVKATENFAESLDGIREFLREVGEASAFEPVLGWIFETVIPNLERFPRIGRDFLARTPQSVEGRQRLETLLGRLGDGVEIREYIGGEHLLLYAVRGREVLLLAIKHHRQLSFDLTGHWE